MSNTVVNTNVSALNSHRAITSVASRQMRSSERLSSGMRINRAADDAAGLAISEKMRNQIRGLDQATRNSQDGISLIQTAEGALEEIHRILERTRELTNQASNDPLTPEDRDQIHAEVRQILEQVDVIARDTEFNTLQLLNGGAGGPGATGWVRGGAWDPVNTTAAVDALQAWAQSAGTQAAIITALSAADPDARAAALGTILDDIGLGGMVSATGDSNGVRFTNAFLTSVGITNRDTSGLTGADVDVSSVLTAVQRIATERTFAQSQVQGFNPVDGLVNALREATDDAGITAALAAAGITMPSGSDDTGNAYALIANINAWAVETNGFASNDVRLTLEAMRAFEALDTSDAGLLAEFSNRDALVDLFSTLNINSFERPAPEGDGDDAPVSGTGTLFLRLQTGANAAQRMDVSIDAMSLAGLNLSDFAEDFVAASHEDRPAGGNELSNMLNQLDDAILQVSSQRANLGAIQNRLEHTINNLRVASENLSAANSRIRDTDMAAEMMRYTQANVLQQAGMSMLAQANMAPQAVLQLVG